MLQTELVEAGSRAANGPPLFSRDGFLDAADDRARDFVVPSGDRLQAAMREAGRRGYDPQGAEEREHGGEVLALRFSPGRVTPRVSIDCARVA